MAKATTTALLAGLLALSACNPNEPLILKAINYDVGPGVETANLQLNGVSLRANDGWGMEAHVARAFAETNRNAAVNFDGIVQEIKLRNNQATIEIAPWRRAIEQRNCLVAEMRDRYGCDRDRGRALATVTCVVKDWATLNRQTDGLLLANWQNREADLRNWDQLQVEGRLGQTRGKIEREYRYVGGIFDTAITRPRGGFQRVQRTYPSLTINDCVVRGYDYKLVK